jgi:hypothetical protein
LKIVGIDFQEEDRILISKGFTCKTMFWKTYSNLFDGKGARNGLVAIPMCLVYKENK